MKIVLAPKKRAGYKTATPYPMFRPPRSPWSHDFHDVLREELNTIRPKKEGPNQQEDDDQITRAHREQLVGLAFSGGGIRSATFNLGVLQSLARMKLLARFNYLSSVSGGGYIASWLMAWIKRSDMKGVARNLIPEWVHQPGRKEPAEIHFLRRFSNYLTPKLGWLGADTWTVIAIYLRNLILNFIVLATAFAFLLLVPRLVVLASSDLIVQIPVWVLKDGAVVALVWAALFTMLAMRYFVTRRLRDHPGAADNPHVESASVSLPSLAKWLKSGGIAWYPSKLFDRDFILRFTFRISESGDSPDSGDRHIYICAPMKSGELTSGAQGTAAKILVSAEDAINPSQEFKTGLINSQPAVRRAEIVPGPNWLKVVFSQGICTVYVNDLNLNTLRVHREKPRQNPLVAALSKIGLPVPRVFGWGTFFAIGIDGGEASVIFSSVTVEKIETPADTGSTQGQVQRRVILPLFLAAFLATHVFGLTHLNRAGTEDVWPWPKCVWIAGLGAGALFLGLRLVRKFWIGINWVLGKIDAFVRLQLEGRYPSQLPRRRWPVRRDTTGWGEIAVETFSITFAGALGGLLVRALFCLFERLPVQNATQNATIWGTPALVAVFLLTIVFHIGFLGRAMQDEKREWWGRLGAWSLIYILAWIAIFGVAFYAPPVTALVELARGMPVWLGTISLGWVLTTVSGLIAARSAATGHEKSSIVEWIAKVAPYVFVVGFFFLLSSAVGALLPLIAGLPVPFSDFEILRQLKTIAVQWGISADWKGPAILIAICALIAVILSWRLDINQFSMHLLYRNRLGRCYLGASNRLRRAQPFTGFSADDDFLLSELADLPFGHPPDGPVPYPILSAALNLVGGKELAWQQRKAASFIFSPRFCGYDFPELPPGYSPTKLFANKPRPTITLATAMAISGAAASPNMGYHTSPAPAFLMTVFNVRLGWWLGNPRKEKGYQKSGPLNVLLRLICELFGLTSEEGKYIYLSDGGHFENLGIYELVRRRCRFIVACDAEEDRGFGFGGLGNAIEKCRSDFGIDIDIDVEPIRRRCEKGHSDWHCAIGRIFYSRVDQDKSGADQTVRDGILLYLKSSLTGDEPTDALRYAAANPEFPHQSTADQWFDESQFESYRVLGYHIVQNVFLPLGDADAISALTNEELFVRLSQYWHPPSGPTAEAFSKHAEAIIKIYDELRTNDALQFLNRDIYPEWRILFKDPVPIVEGLAFERPGLTRDQLPESDDEMRAGFYICTAMCDLFEAVYTDLHLEQEFDHPDNRGWMNFFRHWSSAPMFRVTWAIGAGNYGARFRSFCARHLNLELGRCDADILKPEKLPDLPENIDWTDDIGKIADKIVEAIWIWLFETQVGPEVTAKAGLTVSSLFPDSEDRDPDPEIKRKAKARAPFLIQAELDRAEGKEFARRLPKERDEEWYAAATVLEFLKKGVPEEQLPSEWTQRVVELALVHAATIASRVLSSRFQTQLNPNERELIELFFIFHPRLAATAQIVRLSINPDGGEDVCPEDKNQIPKDKNEINFPIGFAILAKTDWPPSPDQPRKLVSLRIQNHLRGMGLGRKALKELFCGRPNLEIELQNMHPKACEVPTDKDYARLSRLFHSVKTDLSEK
jgi:hypothetical protein